MSDSSADPTRATAAARKPYPIALCDLRCWQPSTCSVCRRQKAPKGRSLPLATAGAYCTDACPGNWPNTRHLWDEHDDARHYTDPAGWANHVANCNLCEGTDDGT